MHIYNDWGRELLKIISLYKDNIHIQSKVCLIAIASEI